MAEVIVVFDPAQGAVVMGAAKTGDTFLTRFGGGGLVSGSFGSGSIASGPIASGQLGGIHFMANAVQSGHIASGIGPLRTGIQSAFGGGVVIGAESELWSPMSGLLATRYDFGIGSGGPRFNKVSDVRLDLVDFNLGSYYNLFLGVLRANTGITTLGYPISNVGNITIDRGLGVGMPAPAVSGRISVAEQVDGVDISAHTHTGGAGDAPVILSAGIGSGQVGGVHIYDNAIISGKIASGLQDLTIIAQRRPWVELGRHVVSGGGISGFNFAVPAGFSILEAVIAARMSSSSKVYMILNQDEGLFYLYRRARLTSNYVEDAYDGGTSNFLCLNYDWGAPSGVGARFTMPALTAGAIGVNGQFTGFGEEGMVFAGKYNRTRPVSGVGFFFASGAVQSGSTFLLYGA